MDGGAEKPLGMGYGGFGGPRHSASSAAGVAAIAAARGGVDMSALSAEERQSFVSLQDIVSLLGPIGADTISSGGGGSDIEPLTADGVPSLSPRTTEAHYFDWHHTEADTLDKVDPVELRKNAAMLAVVAYVLADMDGRLVGTKASPR